MRHFYFDSAFESFDYNGSALKEKQHGKKKRLEDSSGGSSSSGGDTERIVII